MTIAIILIIVSGLLMFWSDDLKKYSSCWELNSLTAFGWFVRILAITLGFIGVIKLASKLMEM